MSISPYRVRSIISYRHKKCLCEKCGSYSDKCDHTCIENYIKNDMRGKDIPKDHPFVIKIDIKDCINKISDQVKKRTIISYRLKKNLCPRCGVDPSDLCKSETCQENYKIVDNRVDNKKDIDPRTIITPKKRELSILDNMQVNILNKEYIKYADDNFLKLIPIVKSNQICSKNYIIIDINPSEFNQRIDFSYINYMVRKHIGFVVFLLGNPVKIFSYSDILKFRKLLRVCPIRNVLDQNIINHICGCKRFFGFPSKYLAYCMLHSIPATIFFKNEENFDLHCNIVNLEKNQNVDIEIVKRNILSWRI
jgi:hypothetical protein